MVLRTTRALLPGDRIATSRADHEGVVLRPLRITAMPLRELVTREVAAVRPVGHRFLSRHVVEFTDGARSQPVSAQAGWQLSPTPVHRVIDLTDGADLTDQVSDLLAEGSDPTGAPLTGRRGVAVRSPRRRRPAARGTAARVVERVPGPLSR